MKFNMKLLRSLKIFFMSAFGLCVNLIIIPVLVPVFLLFTLWYFAFKLILKLQYGSDVYKASGRDVIHGRQTETYSHIINSAVRVEGPLNLDYMKERFRNIIQNCLDENGEKRYRKLEELYVKKFGYWVWEKFDKFNIDDHIVIVQPDDTLNGKQYYAKYSNIISESIYNNKYNNNSEIPDEKDLEEPNPDVPWEVTVTQLLDIYGSRPFRAGIPRWNAIIKDEMNGKYTVLLRYHHAIADGLYLIRMLTEDILDESYNIFQWNRKPQSTLVRFSTLCWSFCLLPFGILDMITKHDRNPLHGIAPLTGRNKYYASSPIPMATFQSIRKKLGVSLHAIAISCISSAVSSHFQRRGAIVDSISILSPVPLQNTSKPVELKNKFAVSAITFPTLTNEKLLKKSDKLVMKTDESYNDKICNFTSLERLSRVKASVDETNSNPAILAVTYALILFCSVMPEKLAQALVALKGFTMFFSSMPGSKVESKLWNGAQKELLYWVPVLDPIGVGISILGYNGNIRFGLILDDSFLQNEKEGNAILRDIEIELKNIAREMEEADLSSFPGLKGIVRI